MNGAEVIFALPGGRLFSTPLAELSAADQVLLRSGGTAVPATGAAIVDNFGRAWPREVRWGTASSCKVISEDPKARRYVYESPGYRFHSDVRITDDALRNFSVMFETTRKYAQSVPLGLLGGGRQHNGKLDVLLFGTIDDYIRAGGLVGSSGCFIPKTGAVMVPIQSLGLVKGGTGYSRDVEGQNKVLVHELVHQLTPSHYFAPGSIGWFSEGLAEYMSVTPYTWGYFRLDPHGDAVMKFVTSTGVDGKGGRRLGTRIRAPKLRDFFLMNYGNFSGANANRNYGIGLLITHYFLHMEGTGDGRRVTEFLRGLGRGAHGEASLKPLLGGGTYEKLETEITAAWGRKGVEIQFGG